LAGGGIAGAVYEIGALRAIDDMLIDLTVNDFDIYVGTSAGGLVAAMLANGFSPQEMMQTIDATHPEIRGIEVGDIFQSNIRELGRGIRRLPGTLARIGQDLLRHFQDMALTDFLWELSDVLPTGLYNGNALERYIRDILTRSGCVNRFDFLEKELYIVATDIDTGERAVFGKGGKGIVPISKAVAASSAVPVLYKPVEIFGKQYIDGSIRGNASVDLAIEAGANLVLCINPLVPLNVKELSVENYPHISDEGVRAIIGQVVRILLHAGLRYHIKNLRAKYPDVDIIMIEPRTDDREMFYYNLMHYSSRLLVANHGFESVTVGVSENFDYYRSILARHNIEISRRLIHEELEEIRAYGYDPDVLRKVMERSDVRRLAGQNGSLEGALSRLEINLDRLDQLVGELD
jgi:predicted acylesterase/phospholipase RssA